MKLSVSLPDEDVQFLDFYLTSHDLESRSAVLQQALRTLRDIELRESYRQAWTERETPEQAAMWEEKYGRETG